MICQLTCVSAVAVDAHACCHRSGASGPAFTCATDVCDRAGETVVSATPAPGAPRVSPAIKTIAIAPADDRGLQRLAIRRIDCRPPGLPALIAPLRI